MKDKVILVTGSSQGIGAATARLARSKGATIVVHGQTDSKQLQAVAEELDALKIFCDAGDKTAVASVVQEVIDTFGRIDGLANVAGTVVPKATLDLEDSDWDTEFKANVLGTVNFSQAVAPHMKNAGSGSIVNVSSIRGLAAGSSDRIAVYSASKAAVISLSVALAKSLAPSVRVNTVAPGFTETRLSKTWNDQVWRQLETALLQRVGQPQEIGAAICFLLSDAASFITGQTLVVDGGYMIAGK